MREAVPGVFQKANNTYFKYLLLSLARIIVKNCFYYFAKISINIL